MLHIGEEIGEYLTDSVELNWQIRHRDDSSYHPFFMKWWRHSSQHMDSRRTAFNLNAMVIGWDEGGQVEGEGRHRRRRERTRMAGGWVDGRMVGFSLLARETEARRHYVMEFGVAT